MRDSKGRGKGASNGYLVVPGGTLWGRGKASLDLRERATSRRAQGAAIQGIVLCHNTRDWYLRSLVEIDSYDCSGSWCEELGGVTAP